MPAANAPIESFGFQQQFYTKLPECYVEAEAAKFSSPGLVYFNTEFAQSIKANFPEDEDALASLFSAQTIPHDAKPIAQAYAGHQFGHFNPQLGDGRAMILGELSCTDGSIIELDLKGSGPTNFSRNGDGKAGLGAMLREVLISEGMHALGVATTRSLAVVTTGEQVFRSPPQAGAVLARTASSHIRIGTFQFFAARKQNDVLEKLVHYCIDRHYPLLKNSPQPAFDLLHASIKAQAKLVAQWMGVGFIHGVMNTDNMLIGAETIDYGPCAFMDIYDSRTVFSSIDKNSRYAYMNQPPVAQWNLARFAETLLPLLHEDHDEAILLATDAVKSFSDEYAAQFRLVMSCKLGLQEEADPEAVDSLIEEWNRVLYECKLDWTSTHRALSDYLNENIRYEDFIALFQENVSIAAWLEQRSKLSKADCSSMLQVNPIVIPRNHLVEEALDAASLNANFAPFDELLAVLQAPFTQPKNDKYTQAAPTAFTDDFVTYCGT